MTSKKARRKVLQAKYNRWVKYGETRPDAFEKWLKAEIKRLPIAHSNYARHLTINDRAVTCSISIGLKRALLEYRDFKRRKK